MSAGKQWVPNKRSITKATALKPFDGSVVVRNGINYFVFSCPGLIGGKFPNNMWASASTLFSQEIPKNDQWFIVAECQFSANQVTSVNLDVYPVPPTQITPTKSAPPTSFSIILWAGYGTAKAYKLFDGNVIIKPVMVFRSYKDQVNCGLSNYEDYYSFAAVT